MSYRPIYEEEYDGLVYLEYKQVRVEKPSFMILGLPDAGLVGVIASTHLVRTLGMEEYGGIDSPKLMPPIAVINKGAPRPPLRLFHKDNIIVLVAETAIPPAAINTLSEFIIEYARRMSIDYLVSIVGLAAPNRLEIEKPSVYWLASSDEAKSLAEKLGVKMMNDGYLVGPYALVLKEAVRKRVNNLILLAEAFMDFPDPEAAAAVLQVLSKAIGKEVDVKKLLEEAEMIRLRMKELMKQTRQALSEMRRGYEYQPPLLYT
ncbi:hypothetical protein Pyrfu_1840 [Pyrolobus fumarii 1A]|uniref:Proteasome assembly chaperone family protein n=1 Tax=Pyrolobus fumarii (strain DSM 11204 / 1A) TaxID=694429 RepID=G0ECX4_PYRF1|nr:proteasome assembly chaperone family protein [Pyrolobus fumarii]AEM39694.1 hypothetical protein Pyrfu_1840 [Pyrolobus fumarii 1A]